MAEGANLGGVVVELIKCVCSTTWLTPTAALDVYEAHAQFNIWSSSPISPWQEDTQRHAPGIGRADQSCLHTRLSSPPPSPINTNPPIHLSHHEAPPRRPHFRQTHLPTEACEWDSTSTWASATLPA